MAQIGVLLRKIVVMYWSDDMAWIYLFIASLFEIGWAISLKYTQGFTKFGYNVATVTLMILSFTFLSKALRTLPLGTAYTIWTGIGAVGTVLLGIVLFQEPLEVRRITCIGLIVIGVIGLKLVSPH
ncbi:multidrug efflux SMR transporter [Nostoc sp. ChiSLP03a]|uniref:DMT family transporter n=1 Tax=Nostoc sp. ChiSLP03a TaxID=3075380 RepID=UPI002AD20584|nr:multidrug efflux SMR transporter [Nostoc sp. ChiSLP03a]MDZ8210064.1 multidrug efflux SMR transporter [Nostoc sp. ChiSLP03a]